jgi:hypothetical protein
MEDKEPKKPDEVVVSSAWFGNIALIILVILVLAGAVAYKEYF